MITSVKYIFICVHLFFFCKLLSRGRQSNKYDLSPNRPLLKYARLMGTLSNASCVILVRFCLCSTLFDFLCSKVIYSISIFNRLQLLHHLKYIMQPFLKLTSHIM